MTWPLPSLYERIHDPVSTDGEPLALYCTPYNDRLHKTLRLDPGLEMDGTIQAAASESTAQIPSSAARDLSSDTSNAHIHIAHHRSTKLGIGTIGLSRTAPQGATVRAPVSHYDSFLRQAVGQPFATAHTPFDAGYAAGVAAFIYEPSHTGFPAQIGEYPSTGASPVTVELDRINVGSVFPGVGYQAHNAGTPPPPWPDTQVDEASVAATLTTLNLCGNEDRLFPRFAVILTRHFASFYSCQPFEFIPKTDACDMRDAAELLCTDTAHRDAFHAYTDQVHGFITKPSNDLLCARIYNHYESRGWLDMYAKATHPIPHLAAGAASGIVSLLYSADIAARPALDLDFYTRVFESKGSFEPEQTASFAMGDGFTEIVARR
jgi:hypothetical protein